MGPITQDKWKWFGLPGHFIGGSSCVHHLATKVGKHLISTVGEYRPKGEDGKRTKIGCGRFFETFVFKTIGGQCECGCGLPVFDPSEIDSLHANDAKTADRNHITLCKKYAGLTS